MEFSRLVSAASKQAFDHTRRQQKRIAHRMPFSWKQLKRGGVPAPAYIPGAVYKFDTDVCTMYVQYVGGKPQRRRMDMHVLGKAVRNPICRWWWWCRCCCCPRKNSSCRVWRGGGWRSAEAGSEHGRSCQGSSGEKQRRKRKKKMSEPEEGKNNGFFKEKEWKNKS